jgi:hypothetical protein
MRPINRSWICPLVLCAAAGGEDVFPALTSKLLQFATASQRKNRIQNNSSRNGSFAYSTHFETLEKSFKLELSQKLYTNIPVTVNSVFDAGTDLFQHPD